MLQRNFVIGSVAGLALAGTVLAVAPGFAQSLPRYPTPAEEAQTDALNAEQASAPAAMTVIVAANTDPSYSAAIAQHNAAQSQYDAQLKDYQDKASAYERQKQDYQAQIEGYKDEHALYHAQASDYAEDEHEYDVATGEAPAAVVVVPPARIVHERLIDFDNVRDPDRELAGAPVEDPAGYLIGHFRHMTYQDGTEEAVIMLHNNKAVVVDDQHLRFDPVKDVVVADLTFNELNRLPARF